MLKNHDDIKNLVKVQTLRLDFAVASAESDRIAWALKGMMESRGPWTSR